jgi:hypothetical protein
MLLEEEIKYKLKKIAYKLYHLRFAFIELTPQNNSFGKLSLSATSMSGSRETLKLHQTTTSTFVSEKANSNYTRTDLKLMPLNSLTRMSSTSRKISRPGSRASAYTISKKNDLDLQGPKTNLWTS